MLTCILLSVGLPTQPALADACSDKDQIFWGDQDAPGDWRQFAYGTTNEIRFANRDVNQSCGGYIAAWSTAHISLNGHFGHWVEVGWRIKWDCFFGCEKVFQWFTEWGLNSNAHGSDSGAYPCAKIDGEFHRWRVSNVDGTNNWNLFFNCMTGAGFVALDTFTGTGYHTGTLTGETGRRGGNSTGMSDRHRHLHYKTTSGTWVEWNDPSCRFDDDNNWQGVKDSATQYHTTGGSAGC